VVSVPSVSAQDATIDLLSNYSRSEMLSLACGIDRSSHLTSRSIRGCPAVSLRPRSVALRRTSAASAHCARWTSPNRTIAWQRQRHWTVKSRSEWLLPVIQHWLRGADSDVGGRLHPKGKTAPPRRKSRATGPLPPLLCARCSTAPYNQTYHTFPGTALATPQTTPWRRRDRRYGRWEPRAGCVSPYK
jgi:hypothetical protein